ncbi:MAG: HAMP domain-containing sensor histidine kinase [Lachnoclostridium sp.]|nr:HAMP domain-containing sensor histidine kinase [Lachnoclostridium sp.]
MKNSYRKLKLTIMLEAVFIAAVTLLVGGLIQEYFIDGVYNDRFADIFLRIMNFFHVQEQVAIPLYWKWIGHNKPFFLIVGFLLLFALFLYIVLSNVEKYLVQVEDGIENIISDSTEPIVLITELKPIEEKLNQIKENLRRQEREAQEMEQKKNDMLLFLAHDLKTPLTSVVAYLTMLEEHPEMPEEERARYTHISLEKAVRLGELIHEFFDITKFNLQDTTLEWVDLNLSMMLEQIADELYGVLQEKHLRCEVEAEEDIMISADPDKLVRVFDNILRNAIVYCSENSTLSIRCFSVGNDVKIIFENEGQTIPEEMLDKIFEKFYRADAARSSSTGGAGLGLAIAKQIVSLHDGTISAESEEGKTRFIVTLPREKGGEPDEVHTHSRRAPWGMSGRWKGLHKK